MEIKSLEKTDLDTLYAAFSAAFADYEVQINKQKLKSMLKRRGYNPSLSFAFFDGDRIVSFILNGTGSFNGISTAYDTGTGTLPEYRRNGLATKIFEYSVPFLKEANIKQYLLEVLQHNEKAVSIYKKAGFEITREFNYFTAKKEEVKNKPASSGGDCSISVINPEHKNLSDFWDFYPSWQNSFDSINRAAEDFVWLGAFIRGELAGYCVFEPLSGDITQIAVDGRNRRKGAGSLLFNEACNIIKGGGAAVINTDVACNSITDFLLSKNISIKGKQYEMAKML